MGLRYAILGMLSEKELSGYDLSKEMDEGLGNLWHAKHSQIYTELKRMVDDSLVTFKRVEQEDNPDKKVYSITERGNEELLNWLTTFSFEEKRIRSTLLLKTALFYKLSDDEAMDHLQKYKVRFKEISESCHEIETKCGGKDEFKSRKSMYIYFTLLSGEHYYKSAVDWCERVIDIIKGKKEEG